MKRDRSVIIPDSVRGLQIDNLMGAISSGGLRRGFPNQEGDFSSLSTCATADVRVPYFWFAILDGRPINCLP